MPRAAGQGIGGKSTGTETARSHPTTPVTPLPAVTLLLRQPPGQLAKSTSAATPICWFLIYITFVKKG